MGNLSNLYISQSFVSLIHLATNEAATATSTELQDGLGNGIGVYVNTSGELSASVYSGSVAGIGNVSAFSASVNSRINAITASGGIPTGTVSSSAQITALGFATTASVDALSTSVDSRLDSLEFADTTFVTTASFASFTSSYFTDSSSVDSRLDSLEFADTTFVTTASFNTFSTSVDSRLDAEEFKSTTFATTGSNTFNGNQNIVGSVTASAAKISGLNYPIADGATDQFVTTDGAGNLSLDWVKTLHQNIHNAETTSIVRGTPLYISGSTGDNANVYFADASAANRRPATLIAGDATLAPGGTGTGLISGEIQGVDTSLYPEGTIVYLGVGGGWSATRPSGSNNLVQALGVITRQSNNGRGIIFNQIGNNLPNIAEGYVWVGDSNGIPQAVATSSFATTGSNSFVGNQSIQGNVYISSSTQNDVVVNGQVFISSSATAGTTQPRLTVSGSAGQSIINRNSISTRNATYTSFLNPGVTSMYTPATNDDMGFSVDAGAAGVSNWSTGPVIYVNDTGDNYPAVFGFQNKANYTDGRITALAPLVVSGSVSITSVMNLKPNDPLPSGNIGDLAVSGSSLYFYNGAWTLVI